MAPSYFINAPDVTPLLLLLSIGLFTVVASRVRIRVTVSIGDCQACVSSLPTVVFDTVENSQGGKLLTLYYSIEQS